MTDNERRLLVALHRHIRGADSEGPVSIRNGLFCIDELTRVNFDADDITVYRRDRPDQTFPMWGDRYPFRTITEALDLAVALRLLPARFFSGGVA